MEIYGFLTEYRKFLTALYSEMGTVEEAVSKYLAIAQKIFAQRDARPRISQEDPERRRMRRSIADRRAQSAWRSPDLLDPLFRRSPTDVPC